MLLLGLAVQSKNDRTYSIEVSDDTFATRADRLLREFHDRVLADYANTFDPKTNRFIESPDSIGPMAREAIYYGAEGFYPSILPRAGRQNAGRL